MSDISTSVYIYISKGVPLNSIERRNLEISYTKSTAELQAVGLTELDTTLRAIGLLFADSGTRTNIVCFRRLLLARVQLPGLHKEICRYWDSKKHSLFPKATASTCSSAWAT